MSHEPPPLLFVVCPILSKLLTALTLMHYPMPMTRTSLTFAVFATLCVVIPRTILAQGAADSVRRLDSGWARAYATHDTTFAKALFADSMFATSSGGVVKGREGELADVRPQAGLQMDYFRTEQVVVRAYPGAAVVTGVAQWQFTYNGRLTMLRRRYTSTYVRGGPLGWQMVALHLGPAPG